MLALSCCLLGSFLPWLIVDKWAKNRLFYITDSAIKPLSIIFTITIVLSLCAIAYLAPYAFKAIAIGASEVRSLIRDGSLLPNSILTTLSVTIAACHIYVVLFFYISCLSPKLKKYRIWLIISSLSYVFNCFAMTARDGLVILPCFYIVYFILFKNSFGLRFTKRIKKGLSFVIVICLVSIITFSMSRFLDSKGSVNHLYQGTVGYISQQPYVFNITVEEQNDFWGFERSFPLLNRIMGIPDHDIKFDKPFEWSFGTMYSEFYSAFAWYGIILIGLTFILYYSLSLKHLIYKRNTFGILTLFAVYLFIAITGLFYMRAGNKVNMNIFYAALSIIPFFLKNYIGTKILK